MSFLKKSESAYFFDVVTGVECSRSCWTLPRDGLILWEVGTCLVWDEAVPVWRIQRRVRIRKGIEIWTKPSFPDNIKSYSSAPVINIDNSSYGTGRIWLGIDLSLDEGYHFAALFPKERVQILHSSEVKYWSEVFLLILKHCQKWLEHGDSPKCLTLWSWPSETTKPFPRRYFTIFLEFIGLTYS